MRDSANISIEVVKTAGADIGDIHERGLSVYGLSTTRNGEDLLSKGSINFDEVGTSSESLSDSVATGLDNDISLGGQEGNNVDSVVHGLVTIGQTLKVVTGIVVGRSSGSSVGSITVEGLEVSAVPVDELIILDVVVDLGSLGLVSSNEGLSEFQPTIVRHVIDPFGRTYHKLGMGTTDRS